MDTDVYWRSIKFLSHQEAIPSLLSALNSKNENIRGTVVYILGDIGNEEAADELVKLIKDSSLFVLKRVIGSLVKILNEDSISYLKMLASHPDPSVRARIATHLGEIKSLKGLKLLVTLLKDENKTVQRKAAMAYRSIKKTKEKKKILSSEEKKEKEKKEGKEETEEDTGIVEHYTSLDIQIQNLVHQAFTETNLKKRKEVVKQLLNFCEQKEEAKEIIIQKVLQDKEATVSLIEEDTMQRKQTLMECTYRY